MKARNKIFGWALPVLAVVALGCALGYARRAREVGGAVAVADRQRDELRQRLQQAEKRLAIVEQVGVAGQVAVPSKAVGETAAGVDPAPTPGRTKARPERESDPRIVAARDVALRELHLKAFAADIDGNWGPLFRRLNLTPEKIEQFKAILLDHERNRLDVTAVAGDEKLGLGDAAVQKQRSDDGAVLARKMRALLEPADLKAYNQYHHDFELQPIVAEMAGRVYFTERPLDLPQAQELMTILSNNSEKRNYGFVRPNTVNWDAALAQVEANPVFSPALIDAFRRLQAARAAEAQLGKSMNEAMKKNAGGEPVSIMLPGSDFIRGGR